MNKSELITRAASEVKSYAKALEHATPQEIEDNIRVLHRAELIVEAFSLGDVAKTKLEIYAFSRTVSDSYSMQPPEFKNLSSTIRGIHRYLEESS